MQRPLLARLAPRCKVWWLARPARRQRVSWRRHHRSHAAPELHDCNASALLSRMTSLPRQVALDRDSLLIFRCKAPANETTQMGLASRGMRRHSVQRALASPRPRHGLARVEVMKGSKCWNLGFDAMKPIGRSLPRTSLGMTLWLAAQDGRRCGGSERARRRELPFTVPLGAAEIQNGPILGSHGRRWSRAMLNVKSHACTRASCLWHRDPR